MNPRGELLAVVGPVGSGKSSLVSAILGEMELPRPKARVSLTASRDSLSSEKGAEVEGEKGKEGEGEKVGEKAVDATEVSPAAGESKDAKSPVRINGTVAYCSQQVRHRLVLASAAADFGLIFACRLFHLAPVCVYGRSWVDIICNDEVCMLACFRSKSAHLDKSRCALCDFCECSQKLKAVHRCACAFNPVLGWVVVSGMDHERLPPPERALWARVRGGALQCHPGGLCAQAGTHAAQAAVVLTRPAST